MVKIDFPPTNKTSSKASISSQKSQDTLQGRELCPGLAPAIRGMNLWLLESPKYFWNFLKQVVGINWNTGAE